VPASDPARCALLRAADQYVVACGDRTTVIAGYPWFGDWGRDTMISLPGLALATGRADVARQVLRAFAGFADRGMLPNRFPEAGEEPEYNTVDATLWFFEAVRRTLEATGDEDFVWDELYPVLSDIIAWHETGTRYGIRVDDDGLLQSGAEGVALTWMDARVGGLVVTPRPGKPVEIQALWYNALRVMEDLAARFGDTLPEVRYASMAARARTSFRSTFWNEKTGSLYDVVDGEKRDASVRPNQVLAVSLAHSMLDPGRARRVLDLVASELLTPYGLRTLSPKDPRYRGRYEGDAASRDASYHQGTVWPWLLGHFVDALLKLDPDRALARSMLGGLERTLHDACLGQISEIFDATPPFRPRGCFAQAWSVAEALRVWIATR